MSGYYCPKDGTPLSWVNLLKKGRWHCDKCNGNLIFQKSLRSTEQGRQFIDHMNSEALKFSDSKCLECGKPMQKGSFKFNGVDFDVDSCRACECYWFSPPHIEASDFSKPARRYRPSPQEDHSDLYESLGRAIFEASQEREDFFNLFKRYPKIRLVKIPLFIFCSFLIYKNYAFYHTLSPQALRTGISVPKIGYVTGGSPLHWAVIGTVLIFLSPKRFRPISYLFGIYYLLMSTLAWLASK